MSPFWLSAGTASLHHVQPGSPDNWNPRQVVACRNPVNPTLKTTLTSGGGLSVPENLACSARYGREQFAALVGVRQRVGADAHGQRLCVTPCSAATTATVGSSCP